MYLIVQYVQYIEELYALCARSQLTKVSKNYISDIILITFA